MKTNGWEFFKCGREAGGVRARELSTCSAALEWTLNGAHGGRNARIPAGPASPPSRVRKIL